MNAGLTQRINASFTEVTSSDEQRQFIEARKFISPGLIATVDDADVVFAVTAAAAVDVDACPNQPAMKPTPKVKHTTMMTTTIIHLEHRLMWQQRLPSTSSLSPDGDVFCVFGTNNTSALLKLAGRLYAGPCSDKIIYTLL